MKMFVRRLHLPVQHNTKILYLEMKDAEVELQTIIDNEDCIRFVQCFNEISYKHYHNLQFNRVYIMYL